MDTETKDLLDTLLQVSGLTLQVAALLLQTRPIKKGPKKKRPRKRTSRKDKA